MVKKIILSLENIIALFISLSNCFPSCLLLIISSVRRISSRVWWALALCPYLSRGCLCARGRASLGRGADQVARDPFNCTPLVSVSVFFSLPEKCHPVSYFRTPLMGVGVYEAACIPETEQEKEEGFMLHHAKNRLSPNSPTFTLSLAPVLWWIHLSEFRTSWVIIFFQKKDCQLP